MAKPDVEQAKAKNILFLVSSMQGGGAERVAALLCNRWVEQGHEVTLMPTFSGRGDCVYPIDEGVRLDFLADYVDNKSRSILNKLQRYLALRRVIRITQPDVILSFLPHVNVAAILAAWGMGVPVVVAERTFPPAMSIGRVLEVLRRFTYSRATTVVVQTQRALAWLDDCCPRANGRVIPNPVVYPLPVGTPILAPTSLIAEIRCVVLAVGRLSEEKGFDQLLSAFETLATPFPKWDLVILGEGPERELLESTLERLGLSDRVYLPGRVGNPGDWYARADLYVMSSSFEGFPNTLVEAMAHGLPAISFDCKTGPADIIRKEVDGYLIHPDEGATGLANAMGSLMEDENKRRCMGQEAILVRERFAGEKVMAAWDEVLGIKQEYVDA